jgi:cytochrome P450
MTGVEQVSSGPVPHARVQPGSSSRLQVDAPATGPAARLGRLSMTRDALTVGLSPQRGWVGRISGHDVTRFRTGTRRFVALCHPEHIDHVLHDGWSNYHKSYEYETLRAILGVSLFTDEDASWQRYRSMLTPMFAKRHLNGLVDLMIEPVDSLLADLDARSGRIELDMVREMVELTLNVVGNALFSQGFGAVAQRMSPMVTGGLRFGERLLRLFLVTAPPPMLWRSLSRVAFTPLPLPPPFRRIQRIVRVIDDAVWTLIDDRRAHPVQTPDLLNHLLNAGDDQGGLSIKRARDEAITFMLAGHETTANALSWMWYLLALNPDARTRLLDEVDAVLQGRTPTADDLSNLPWTTAVFLEAMRYYSPAWAIPRVAVRDDVIGGHHVRKGTTVIIPVHLVHHDPRWWPNPEEFDPTRFLPGESRHRPRSAYLPFGGGKRGCIGQGFATMESVLITAMLSQRYVFDLVPGHPVEPEATLTLRPRHGLKMIARRRNLAS